MARTDPDRFDKLLDAERMLWHALSLDNGHHNVLASLKPWPSPRPSAVILTR